jgi:dTDP-glucose 4,6-dehydratase
MIHNCLEGKPLPVYGTGANVRDWLYVEDHAEAIWTILERGKRGETYDIGGRSEMSNLALLHLLIATLKEIAPGDYDRLIRFVPDRLGHDFRYAIDFSKIEKELGWQPKITLEEGLRRTIKFFHLQEGGSRDRRSVDLLPAAPLS